MLKQSLWTSNYSAFRFLMASDAKHDQITQIVRRVVITVKKTIRLDVMHFYNVRLAVLGLLTAYLAFMPIAFKSLSPLTTPVLAAIFWATALVVYVASTAAIDAHRGELTLFRAISAMALEYKELIYGVRLTANLAHSSNLTRFTAVFILLTFAGTESWINTTLPSPKLFAANFAVENGAVLWFCLRLFAVLVCTLLTAIHNSIAAFCDEITATPQTGLEVTHSVSLSLYHMMVLADGVICRRFGSEPSQQSDYTASLCGLQGAAA